MYIPTGVEDKKPYFCPLASSTYITIYNNMIIHILEGNRIMRKLVTKCLSDFG